MIAAFLLILLFFLTIGHELTLKICSARLDHRTAPIYISGWTLLGLVAVMPLYGHLWAEGFAKMMADPVIFVFAIVKGLSLYLLFIISQELMKESLSSRHYVTPMAVGLIAIGNSFFGEHLSLPQWVSALGLCAVATAFFFKGHLSDLSRAGKITYAKLVALGVLGAVLDQTLTSSSNWYALLWVSNIILFSVSLMFNARNTAVLKTAFLNRQAVFAGVFYAATELVKFYQQVTINPLTVVIMVQILTKPVILVLSALIWKERTVREQLIWGSAAFVLVMLPFFWTAG